ncbi:hypothetical protein GCM10010435_83810 [Winogradskya consettensis]|uniref:CATRA-Associated Small Protein domain-containing protein n=1 Tax=Winogradskya consettensis TaxID=113560 RepID=A0A919T293_9ACTN|nr:hypothetical protein Aco04nite_80290 [Actinoplanes consettensis]
MVGMEPGVRERALQVLQDALLWDLTVTQWTEVGYGLRRLRRACDAGDDRRQRDAVADLEVAGPHRVSGLEDAGRLPAPREVRERINELIHTLGPPVPSAQRAAGQSRETGRSAERDSDAGT